MTRTILVNQGFSQKQAVSSRSSRLRSICLAKGNMALPFMPCENLMARHEYQPSPAYPTDLKNITEGCDKLPCGTIGVQARRIPAEQDPATGGLIQGRIEQHRICDKNLIPFG
jgi:hypothetical protein